MATAKSSAPQDQQPPKYACRVCGSDVILGSLDSYSVYVAEGNRLYFLRTEIADVDDQVLRCRDCGEEIEEPSEEAFAPPMR